MKSLIRLATVAIAVAGLSTSAHAAKKKPLDLSEFKGNYTGTVAITAGTTNLTGTATINVAVPKSGRSAVVTVNAQVITGDPTAFTLANTLTFAANKTFTQAQIIYGLGEGSFPTAGTYTGKKALNFSGQFIQGSINASFQGTLSVKPLGKKHRRLVLTNVVTVAGSTTAFNFTFDALAKVKTPKK